MFQVVHSTIGQSLKGALLQKRKHKGKDLEGQEGDLDYCIVRNFSF